MNHDVIIKSISEHIYQAILLTYQHHPQWLINKFRKYPWSDSNFQEKFMAKLMYKLENTENTDVLVNQLINLLRNILLPCFFVSYQFTELIANIRKYTHPALQLEAEQLENYKIKIAILLVDAENINLDVNLEKLIKNICHYPLKIKLAFANWRCLGKKDIEFHSRDYEMIHVPAGKNNADLKMISFGSSIWSNYPTAQEVVVCSSDTDLNNLCANLHNHGLTVYRVTRKNDNVQVFNSKTNAITTYSLSLSSEFFSLENFITKIREIIQEEQAQTHINWIKLARLSQLFQNKYIVSFSQILHYYFPSKKTKDIFLNFKHDFSIHQIGEDEDELYISIFDFKKNNNTENIQNIKLNSKEDIETAIINIIKVLSQENNLQYIDITTVASEFLNKYNVSITTAIKNVELGGKYINILKSSHKFDLKRENNIYMVAIA